ncbi:MAG: hypothetical protein ACTHKD_15690 [Devosia sp.]|jgi:regulator of nucleoside diphosphate kinase
MIGADTPLASLVRRKLGSAIVMLECDVGSNVIAPGRRVRFTIDGYRTKERTLTWEPHVRGDRRNVSLLAPTGLALLGLSVGESISYRTATRRIEFIQVDHVFPDDDNGVPHREPLVQHDASLEADVYRADLQADVLTLA